MVALDFPVRFENPSYSLLGIVLGIVVLALFYLSHKRLKTAEKRLELIEWRKLRRIVRALNIGTKAGVVIALSLLIATPYLQTTTEIPVEKASEEQSAQYTITVMLLMDVSNSMNYSDLKPTRLEASQTISKMLIDKMNSKDLIGLVSFAGQIYDTVAPTTDRTKIAEKIDNQTLHPSTAIGTALETAIGTLETYSGGKAIVLFSDGSNNFGANLTSAVADAVAKKIPVFTVSLGTYGVGEADAQALKEISSMTNGKFYEARNENVESLATSISQFSQEVKLGALKAVYDKLIIATKDYQTPRLIFSALLVTTLFLTWFIGV